MFSNERPMISRSRKTKSLPLPKKMSSKKIKYANWGLDTEDKGDYTKAKEIIRYLGKKTRES